MPILKKALVFSLPIWVIFTLDTIFSPFTRTIPSEFYSPGIVTIILLNPTWAGIHTYSTFSLVLYNCVFYFWVVVGFLLVLSKARKTKLPIGEVKWLGALAGVSVIAFVSLGIRNRVSNKIYEKKWWGAYEEILQITLNADSLRPYYCTAGDGSPQPVVIVDDGVSLNNIEIQTEVFGQPVKFVSTREAHASDSGSCFWNVDFSYYDDTLAELSLSDTKRKIRYYSSYRRWSGDWCLQRSSMDSIKIDTLVEKFMEEAIQLRKRIIERSSTPADTDSK